MHSHLEEFVSNHIQKFYSNVDKELESRLHNFLRGLMASGDLYLQTTKTPPYMRTENSFEGDRYVVDLNHHSLFCYEPYKRCKELEEEIERLKSQLLDELR